MTSGPLGRSISSRAPTLEAGMHIWCNQQRIWGAQAPPKPLPEAARFPAGRVYTMAEVEKHASAKSAWFVHGGKARSPWPTPSCYQGS